MAIALGFWILSPHSATAQGIGINSALPIDGATTARMFQMAAILTVLSLAPGLLIMVSSFTRFVIAFSFLRTGLGLQGTPANMVLIALSLFMTFYVMAPTFDVAWRDGIQPLMTDSITREQAYAKTTAPFREFMVAQVREKDLAMFETLAKDRFSTGRGTDVDLRILVPAFMISELRRGFEIGFLILLPFLVIDLIVAILTMSMGMMMLPPSVISLPAKVMFFVLIDGWNLLVGSLLRSIN